jgi:hypothetical protein
MRPARLLDAEAGMLPPPLLGGGGAASRAWLRTSRGDLVPRRVGKWLACCRPRDYELGSSAPGEPWLLGLSSATSPD